MLGDGLLDELSRLRGVERFVSLFLGERGDDASCGPAGRRWFDVALPVFVEVVVLDYVVASRRRHFRR